MDEDYGYPLKAQYFKSHTLFNPLSPNNEQHQFSPNNTHMLPREMVMRVNKMITEEARLRATDFRKSQKNPNDFYFYFSGPEEGDSHMNATGVTPSLEN